ncbi:hypothetical protein [Streptomyces indiaensis]|uniref:Uncharacterized protein n=1 Tax=Streptomyces indiaensis TaxID=284033 RepID=A0ABN3E4B9_9ACTN|nr:hypothetical protein [Streptomyces indiaensis]MCF1645383.1 hypothetical protein [Streptomyces indiaensis]
MAAVIACSWPPADLTALAHRHKPSRKDDVARAITACATPQERARPVAEALIAGGASALDFTGAPTKYSDRPAAQRMADLVTDPRPVLGDVAEAFRTALRRLYGRRSIILHRGATQGVALEVSLRTAAPLVGTVRTASCTLRTPKTSTHSTSRPGPKSPFNSSTARHGFPLSTA